MKKGVDYYNGNQQQLYKTEQSENNGNVKNKAKELGMKKKTLKYL